MNKKTVYKYVLLHSLLFVFSLLGIFSKKASQEDFLSTRFIVFYGIVLLNLAIFAICWQQILKKIQLVVAVANKAILVVWGILWGRIFFEERISITKIVGAIIIIMGIALVVLDREGENDD